MHGTTKAIYEELMPGANYECLLALIKELRDVKHKYPGFKLRVNYTVNSLNIVDLKDNKFWDLWGEDFWPDIVQIRPVQNMGDTEWNDFDLTPIKENYDFTIGAISRRCSELGITCIVPSLSDIDAVSTPQDGASALIEDLTYCYVSPQSCYHADFDASSDTYESYHRRKHTVRRLLRMVFRPSSATRERNASKKLNYHVK